MVMVVSISIMGISGVFFDHKQETDSNVNNMNCSFVINRQADRCVLNVLIGIPARKNKSQVTCVNQVKHTNN